MTFVLAELAASQWPMFFAILAGAVGMAGILYACASYSSVVKDRDVIRNAESTLASSEDWTGSRPSSAPELACWMEDKGIPEESGVADVIRACWSACLGSRAPSLTELHALVARRERSKPAARVSAGIAALLLVIGIVGTLFSVKPVLQAFNFEISTEAGAEVPEISNVATSAEQVNTLLHSLGDAFLPSLAALVFTILVVASRGVYSLALNRYTLELDRFAMGTVMPHYQPVSISSQYDSVRSTFLALARSIETREQKFDKVVTGLSQLKDDLEPAIGGLNQGVRNVTKAADSLASRSNSIATTLTSTLGKNSPLCSTLNGFEGIFTSTNGRLEELSKHIQGIREDHLASRQEILKTLEEISTVTEKVSSDHQGNQDAVSKSIGELKSLVGKIPDELLDSSNKTFHEGMTAMRESLKESLEQQAREASASRQDSQSRTKATLELIEGTLTSTTAEIRKSIQELPAAVERLDKLNSRDSETVEMATSAINAVAETAKDSIRESCEDVINALRKPDRGDATKRWPWASRKPQTDR